MVSVIRLVVGQNIGGVNGRAEVKEKPVVGRRATRSQSSKQRTAAASGKKLSTADISGDAGAIVEKKPEAVHITRPVAVKVKVPEAAHITPSVTAKAMSRNVVDSKKKFDPPHQKKKSGPGKSIAAESNSDIGDIAAGQRSTAGSGGSKLMGSVKRRVARKSHKHGIKVSRPGCGAKAKILGSSTHRPSAKGAEDSPQSLVVDSAAVAKAAAAAAPTGSEPSASSTANLSPSLTNVLKILRTDSDETNTSKLFEEDDQDDVGTKSKEISKTKDGLAKQHLITEASSSVAFVTPSPYVNPSEEDIFVRPGRSSPESESDEPSKVASSDQKRSECDGGDRSKAPAKSTKKSPAEQELVIATGRVMAAQKVGWLLPPVDMAAAAANPQSEDSPSSEGATSKVSTSAVQRKSAPLAVKAPLPPNFSASSRNDVSQEDKYANFCNTNAAPTTKSKPTSIAAKMSVEMDSSDDDYDEVVLGQTVHRIQPAFTATTARANVAASMNMLDELARENGGSDNPNKTLPVRDNADNGCSSSEDHQSKANVCIERTAPVEESATSALLTEPIRKQCQPRPPCFTVHLKMPIGLSLMQKRSGLYTRVEALQPDGPAHKSGMIRVGDVLAAVSGEDVRTKPLNDVLYEINKAGSSVTLIFLSKEALKERMAKAVGTDSSAKSNVDATSDDAQNKSDTKKAPTKPAVPKDDNLAHKKVEKDTPTVNDTNHRVEEKQAKLDRAKGIAKKRVTEEYRRKDAASNATSNAKEDSCTKRTSTRPHIDTATIDSSSAGTKKSKSDTNQSKGATSNGNTKGKADGMSSPPRPPPVELEAATASPNSTNKDANTDVPVITKDCVLQGPDGSWSAYVLRADQTYSLGPFVKKEIASVALGSFQFYIQIESRSTHGVLTVEMLDRARKLTMHVMSLADNNNAGRINWSEWHRLMHWNAKYRQLCIRKSEDDASAMGDNEDALFQWAECQRKLFRNEDPSLTTQMKILLNDINFDWAGGQDDIEDTRAAEEECNSSKKSSNNTPEAIEAGAAALSHDQSPPPEHPALPQPSSPGKQDSGNNTKSPSEEEEWRCLNCKHENRKRLKRCGSCHKLRPEYERPRRKGQVPVICRWSLRKPHPSNKDDEPTVKPSIQKIDNRTRMSLRSRPARKNTSSGIVRTKAMVSTSNKSATNGSKRPRGRPSKQLCSIDGCRERMGIKCNGKCLAHYRESTADAGENMDDSAANQEKRPAVGDIEANANEGGDELEFVAEAPDAEAARKRSQNALDAPTMAHRSRSARTPKRASDGDIETVRNAPSKRPRRHLDSSGNFVERKSKGKKKHQSDSEEDEEDIEGVKRQRSIAQVKARMYRIQAKGYMAEMDVQEDVHKQKQRADRRRLEKTKEESSEKDSELDDKDRLLEIIKSLLPGEEDVRAEKRGNIRSIRELLDDADVRDS